MWPFVPASEIDWPATAAVISAFVAIGALAWNVWWSTQQARKTIGQRLAQIEVQWIESFREQVSIVSNSGNLLNLAKAGPWDERAQTLQKETLYNIGKLDLMFAGYQHPSVANFMGALFAFREGIKVNAEGGVVNLGPLNTLMREQANNVMAEKHKRVRDLLEGKL